MPEITTRRQGEIVRTLFGILAKEPEGLQAKEAIARVQDAMVLTPFELSTWPSSPGEVRFPRLVRFSTINAVKAGWLRKVAGIWTVTEEGLSALDEFPDAEALYAESRRLYRSWKAGQPKASPQPAGASDGPETGVDADEPDLIAATTLEESEDAARQAILDYLGAVNPYTLQDLVGKLLEAMGYHLVWIAPKGRDGGLDLLAQGDPLGVKGPRIKGQVKRRGEKTTEEELRSFLSLIEQDDVGVYISLAGFTRGAEELARRASRRITLIDGDAFLDLWVEHYDRVDEEGKQLLPIKPVYFLDIDQ
jgi:restriction system protein